MPLKCLSMNWARGPAAQETEATATPADWRVMNVKGIENLVAKLQQTLLQNEPTQRGKWATFFTTNTYHRKWGQKIAE